MDWNAAIEKNREALKRMLAMLVAMAALPVLRACGDAGTRGQFTFFPQDCALPQGLALAEKSKLSPAQTLPRHLHRAVLSLLRPAEAAARRLIIVAARGLAASPQARKMGIASTILRNGVGTGILMPPQASLASAAPRTLALPLFDPLRPWSDYHRLVTRGVPRISVPGYSVPFPVAVPPSPGDPIDATRLALRLQALGRVLDNLPAEARRFARWRAARDAAGAQNKESFDAAGAQNKESFDAAGAQNRKTRGPFRRVWPLRPGRPPGWRRSPTHDVQEILNVVHGLAIWALEDTS